MFILIVGCFSVIFSEGLGLIDFFKLQIALSYVMVLSDIDNPTECIVLFLTAINPTFFGAIILVE